MHSGPLSPDSSQIDFIEVAHECRIVSKGAALVVSGRTSFRTADDDRRAKRYERLMKSNGINPNGGPDPKPIPPSTPKTAKSNTKDHTAKQPAKKRKLHDDAEKSPEQIRTSPTPKPEPSVQAQVEEKSCPPPSGLLAPTTNERRYEPKRVQTRNEEDGFDFDDFCSPEMFAYCIPECTHQPGHGDGSLPILPLCPQPAASITAPAMPQWVQEDRELGRKAERETVIITD